MLPVDRGAQLPDGISLNDETERDDQSRSLQRRQNVEPDRGRDQPERETGQPGHESRDESRCEKERKVGHEIETEIESAHVACP